MSESFGKALELVAFCLAPAGEERVPGLRRKAEAIADWREVWRTAARRHVSSLVHVQMRRAGLLELVPEKLRENFEDIYLNTAAVNTLRVRQVLEVERRLSGAGARMIYLKGASMLFARDYSDFGQRMLSDIDVMLDGAYQEAARSVLEEEGWVVSPDSKEREWKLCNNWGTVLEIHWRLKRLNKVPSFLAEQRLRANALQAEHRLHKLLIPAPEDRFIQSAVHATAHHPFDSSLLFMTAADLAHIVCRHQLDWERMARDLKREQMAEHVAVATGAAYQLTGLPGLEQGLAAIYRSAPGIEQAAAPLTASLVPMLKKPWLFHCYPEMKIYATGNVPERFFFFLQRLKKRAARTLSRGPRTGRPAEEGKEPVERRIEGVSEPAGYGKELGDSDFMRFSAELFKFYRKIGYKSFSLEDD